MSRMIDGESLRMILRRRATKRPSLLLRLLRNLGDEVWYCLEGGGISRTAIFTAASIVS